MARIRTTLATAAILGLAAAGAAQAQTPYPAAPVPPPAMAPAPMAAPMAPPVAPGMPHHRPMHGQAPMHPPGSTHTYGMGGMTPGAAPGMAPPPMTATGRPNMMAAPAQPFSGLTLPPQQQVGNGAYNGGGVVLEYLPDGTTRVVR
ncbi:hypothetical protein [Roseomonas sp. 18066]|uniref:hypothetical protein n=1 Tax=Roseomonas sp. 18066 TaxID=2681412 RepID=UPI00135BDACB|nr:hypothetical protein [Roseomonas sp. 18066]